MYWFEENAAHPVVLSTRVRLARNLSGTPFPDRLTPAGKKAVCDRLEAVYPSYRRSDFSKLSPTERRAYAECHLCSPEFAQKVPEGKSLLVSEDQTVSVMVNEEDHVRIQAIRGGYCPQEAFDRATEADSQLLQREKPAFHERFGFLTSCPTNLGCAMRLSVMLHLPALQLSGKMPSVMALANQRGCTLRGAFGEGSKAEADLFQLSNASSCEGPESKILQTLSALAEQVIEAEQRERDKLCRSELISDKLWRALGTMRYARSVSYEEYRQLWSLVRMGVACGLYTEPALAKLDRALIELMPARLCLTELSAEDALKRDRLRADKMRSMTDRKSVV